MNSKEITLFGFWASSATWRIRAALHYKQLAFNEISIDIVKKDRGWVDYQTKINPMGLVPAIKLPESGERVFSESLPILELLEETYPDAPKLMPTCSIDKHRMRQICEIINAGMQPLQNLSTLRALNLTKEAEAEYVKKMMLRGVGALEQLIDENSDFCLGDTLTMADLFFVPQMRNVVDRFKIDVSDYPKVDRLYKKLKSHECFQLTHPTVQPGAGVDPVAK